MAIIKLGTTIVGIRGTAGGLTFSANQGGTYCKLWGQSSKPRTPAQSLQRGNLARMPSLWRALSGPQQAGWVTWAALPAQTRNNSLGLPYNASGFAWFTALSCNLLLAGRSPIATAPLLARPVAPVILTWVFDSAGVPFTAQITYGLMEFGVHEDIIIQASYKPGGGLQANYQGWKSIIAGIPSPTGTYPFPVEWRDAFGVPAAGGQGWIRVYKQTDEGLRGPASELVTVYA